MQFGAIIGPVDGHRHINRADARPYSMTDALADTSQQIHDFWLEQRRQGLDRGDALAIMPSREPVRNPGRLGAMNHARAAVARSSKCHGGSGAESPAKSTQWLH